MTPADYNYLVPEVTIIVAAWLVAKHFVEQRCASQRASSGDPAQLAATRLYGILFDAVAVIALSTVVTDSVVLTDVGWLFQYYVELGWMVSGLWFVAIRVWDDVPVRELVLDWLGFIVDDDWLEEEEDGTYILPRREGTLGLLIDFLWGPPEPDDSPPARQAE